MDDRPAPNAAAKTGRSAAASALVVAGLLTMLGSILPWQTCSTVGCDSPLQAFSVMSGLDLGYGVVTFLAGIVLTAIGIDALRSDGVSRYATPALLLALLVLATVSAFVILVYVFADDSLSISWPPNYGAILSWIGGLIATVAGLRLRRATRSSLRRAPPT